ncbi:MAG: hypothetical protein WCF84_08475 [Anaerolineae bacterium]
MSLNMTNPRPNPYVGPRAFQPGETLYGRDGETLNLLDLLTAERIVLFYSPSGAGKTSLIQAALLPRLARKGFNVLPPMRINAELPDPKGLDPSLRSGQAPSGLAPASGLNRYVFSALLSLEEGLPAEQRLPLADLAALSLNAYLDGRLAANPARQVLIFDQFEEILTVDPTNVAAKQEFFAQIGAALENRKRWTLFAMREDYIAGLDNYRDLVPTRLDNTYRLDLLQTTAARDAMQKPARQAGVDFTDKAATRLIDDLRRVQVQRPDGTTETQLGQYVEPVQLQVVCLRLWEKLAPEATSIAEADLAGVGDVNTALADYYASRVVQVAQATGERERTIREWFDRELITPGGIRGQVLREPERSRGLSNQAIRQFEDAHLVRAEARRGTIWYELAHDRLVEPVRANNAAWFESHLSVLQQQATLWASQNQRAGLLLSGETLSEAEAWAAEHAAELTATEQDFLADCRKARTQVEQEQRQNRRIRWLAIGATALSVIALIALGLAIWFYFNAVEQQKLAFSRELAADAIANLEVDPERSILLATRAISVTQTLEDVTALRQSVFASLVRVTLRGHTAKICNVAYSPDGKYILTSSYDKTARIWDAITGVQVTVLLGHDDVVWNAIFSPDGTRILTVSQDKTARIWDSKTGQQLYILKGHTDQVFAGVFTPDGQEVVTASYDKTIRIWDVATGNQLKVLQGPQDQIFAVAVSPDGKRIAAAGRDSQAYVWDDINGRQLFLLHGHTGPIRGIAYSPDGKQIATSSDDQTARVWDATNGEELLVLKGHADAVSRIGYSPDGQQIVTTSADKSARIWEAKTGRLLSVLQGHTNWVWTAAYSIDGKKIVTSSSDQTARVWDAQSGRELAVLRGHTDQVTVAAFSPNGSRIVTASGDGTARVWQTPPGRELLVLEGHTNTVFDANFSPDGRRIVTASNDGTVGIWDADTGTLLQTLRGHTGEVWSARFNSDGKRIITASSDATAIIWDAATGKELQRLRGHDGRVWSAVFSPDGRRVATAGDDGTARIWDIASERALLVLDYGPNRVFGVAFSPDGHLLAVSCEDGRVHIVDVESGRENHVLQGHHSVVVSVAFSADGKRIVTASYDHTARIWDAATFQELHILQGHTNWVRSAAFSPDGKQVATISDDGTIRFWDVSTGNELTRLPQHIGSHIAYNSNGSRIVTAEADFTAKVYLTQVDALLALAYSRITRELSCEERVGYLYENLHCQ